MQSVHSAWIFTGSKTVTISARLSSAMVGQALSDEQEEETAGGKRARASSASMEPRQNCRNAPKPLMAFRSSCSIFGNYGGARKASNLVAELHPQGEASSSDDRSANNRETRGSRGFRAGSCR
uniref:Uncharacterized protein n=1 Tax=Vespula pensylvanica TaxID=30213 RepID=A0A834JSR3_VESPE|nr:hypothetical protein H0235_016763 [Vespula pensylvanica]